jgi:polygalacturonase
MQAVTFFECQNLIVKDLKIQNAQQMHVTFKKSNHVLVSNLTVTSPEESPNTDGIHITKTQNIQITDSVIGTGMLLLLPPSPDSFLHRIFLDCPVFFNEGDDCISIVSGSHHVQATGITCGPGHGIRSELLIKHETLNFYI